ncbi:DEAD/DEAH box helicase [Deferribacter autotrophicus]|uniref:DEAD/DEAH box helicase n=1 Tax=Deferribacter autotrophicus TaxID=500465 RepID=A0A5A8F0M1_9BACT|nr:DEAD/DEAH box helicase family protein [Deferribacter autotrophicus]KAA0257569.1 DEAD/DEAH box helicase [Deferribacter autotrophicus]
MKLEKHLVLNKYLLNLFGFNEFNELREKLKDTEEGYDSMGRSCFVDVLIGLKPEWEDLFLRYDEAIREYVERLRQNRKQPNFNLKYFQYLAVLFPEMFLDRYYNDRQRFLNELNEFLKEFNIENGIKITSFTEQDLKKLAFWMATGSGKTLIMHINYWQIMKYSKNNWDNIILITPNEGLSKQHYEELKSSGIPCKLYDGNIDNLKTRNGEVLIIDIHKLTEEKKGEGVSIDISYFDGKNLVFIDEGHKGQKSEERKWKRLREEIGKDGFLFEYSATFGQVIGKNKDLLEEYAKAIIFDYSYKYFYTDGYGKDFYVYNIQSQKKENKEYYSEEQQNLLLTAGLLSFYEQLTIFENNKEKLREYNIEKPLWIFVGSKVSGKGLDSDVVRVIQFLEKTTRDEKYLNDNVKKILKGESGLIDNEGNDIFNGKFEYIRKLPFEKITEGIYQKIFGGKGKIEIYEIKNAEGEIGLKTSTAEKYFSVINVGDVGSLLFYFKPEKVREKIEKLKKDKKKNEEKKNKEINELNEILNYIEKHDNLIPKEDHFSQSLFFGINESDSHINILIGSKKFIEGWNSWRVSNMGLINMGKSEGSQIIQLFGRGVRLKGKEYSLKRAENPDYKLKALQTLFIFGLNADYINAFLATLEKEEVDYEEITIPIKFNMSERWEGKIYTIKTKDDFNFLNHPLKLTIDENILRDININLRPKITITRGLSVGTADSVIDDSLTIPQEYFEIVDWDSFYSEIINYKITKGMFNLIIDREIIKQIVKSGKYKIFLHEAAGISVENNNGKPVLKIRSFEGIKKFHEIILMALKDYIFKFYRKEEKRKTMDYLEVEPLTINEHSFMYPENKEVILKIPKKLASDIEEVIKQLEEYDSNNDELPEIWKKWDSFIVHLNNHLYTPLIIWKKNKEETKSIPVKLNKGETKFVTELRVFLNRNKELLKEYDIFLLRNLSRKGIGFFFSSGFYPDFIIWVKNESKQNVIFIDPKGLQTSGVRNFYHDKIQFCVSYIKKIESKVNKALKNKNEKINLQLDAFILSVSSYDDVKTTFGDGKNSKDEFEAHNIIFEEDTKYIRKIFEKVGVIANN